jgi:hypothetical protein
MIPSRRNVIRELQVPKLASMLSCILHETSLCQLIGIGEKPIHVHGYFHFPHRKGKIGHWNMHVHRGGRNQVVIDRSHLSLIFAIYPRTGMISP